VAAKSGLGDPSAVPIFVLGMPRSGTTLVEHILASHPDVHGAGELKTINAVVDAVHGPEGKHHSVSGFRVGARRRGARPDRASYLSPVRALAPDAARITDELGSVQA
jgi:hypothetical protein